jgi:hypothetical protein
MEHLSIATAAATGPAPAEVALPSRRALVAMMAGAAGAYALAQASGPAVAAAARLAGSPTTAAGAAVRRGGVRQYARPMIQPGYRLVLPAGVRLLPQRSVAHTSVTMAGDQVRAWPAAPLGGGSAVDLSRLPEPGTPAHTAYAHFPTGRGWYLITDASGREVARRAWDASAMPMLRLAGEWGGTRSYPYYGQFYTLALEPMSHPV